MGAGDFDGAVGALTGIVRTEPSIEFVALLNETLGVALTVDAANLLVDKIGQAAPETPDPGATRVEAAHDMAARGLPEVSALAEYRKAVAAGDDAAARSALTLFIGHPSDDAAFRGANMLLGLRGAAGMAEGAAR